MITELANNYIFVMNFKNDLRLPASVSEGTLNLRTWQQPNAPLLMSKRNGFVIKPLAL